MCYITAMYDTSKELHPAYGTLYKPGEGFPDFDSTGSHELVSSANPLISGPVGVEC